MRMSKTYVHKVPDIPIGEHWAILGERSIYIPGDERSRTNPGHGYPATTEYYVDYVAYTMFAEFEADLKDRLGRGELVRGIHIKDTYSKKVVVAVEIAKDQ